MSEVTNNDLLTVLLGVKEDIGELKSTVASQARAFAQHVQDDAAMSRSLGELKLGAAKRAGAAGVWSLLYGAISGAIAAAATYWAKH